MNTERHNTNKTRIWVTFASLTLAALIGSGCSSMHNITSSYQINEESETVSLAKVAVSQPVADTVVTTSTVETPADSEESFVEFEASEEVSTNAFTALNSIAEEILGQLNQQTEETVETVAASTVKARSSSVRYIPSDLRYFQSANLNQAQAFDANGDCQFSGADITRLVANANGQSSLNHCNN